MQLFLNAGDHAHMKTAFLQVLDECGLEFEIVGDTKGVRAFQERLLIPTNEPNKNVTLFTFEEYELSSSGHDGYFVSCRGYIGMRTQ